MNESKIRDDIYNLAQKYLEIKEEIESKNNDLKTIKEEIIGLLEELQTTKIRNENMSIEVQFPVSFGEITNLKLKINSLKKIPHTPGSWTSGKFGLRHGEDGILF